MWISPKFIKRRASGLIHEDASQMIQGGLPGEHYHISAALYQSLIQLINNPVYAEAVTSLGGETVFAIGGDIVTALLRAPANAIPQTDGSTGTASPISDVVTPPVATPAPLPAPVAAADPLWNYVTFVHNWDLPVKDWLLANRLTSEIGLDQYGGYATFAWVQAYPSSGYPTLWYQIDDAHLVAGNPTVHLNWTVSGHFPTIVCYPKQYGDQSAYLSGDFTLEAYLVPPANNPGETIKVGPGGTGTVQINTNVGGSGNLEFGVVQYTTGIPGWSSQPNQYLLIPFTATPEVPYLLTLERNGDYVTLAINGVIKGTIYAPGNLGRAAQFIVAGLGPVRITSGISRYKTVEVFQANMPTGLFPTRGV